MASISNQKDQRKTIQFVADDGKRRSIRLGKASKRQAERICDRIEHLVSASRNGESVDTNIREWLSGIDDVLHTRLERVGLVEPRENGQRQTLRSLIDLFSQKRNDVKDSTRSIWKQAHESLIEEFGETRKVDTINLGEAEDWRNRLLADDLAEATIRKRTRNVNLLFNWAIKRGFVESNPFADLPSASTIAARKPYVSPEKADAVIAHLPSAHWRAFFACGRYAAMRLPGEPRALRRRHVDWDRNRIEVQVPKLAHLPGHEVREVPIFADFRPYLLEVYELEGSDDDPLILLPEVSDTYLRKIVIQAIEKAGLKPWSHLFNALRASCETDLMREHPPKAVCDWTGHDIRIAHRHYLQVTDDDFEKAVQNPVQHRHARRRMPKQTKRKTRPCKSMQGRALGEVGDVGFEPT